MTPRSAALGALRELPVADWDAWLLAHSGLPGPRGNLEVVVAAADLATPAQMSAWLAYSPSLAPYGSATEFLPVCGTVGRGRLLVEAEGDPAGLLRLLEELRGLAVDARRRVREGVAMALQRWGAVAMPSLLGAMAAWAASTDRLVQRAVVAGLCEPPIMRRGTDAQRVVVLLDGITATIVGAVDRRSDHFGAIRRGRRGRPCGVPGRPIVRGRSSPTPGAGRGRPCGGARASDRAWQEQPDARGRRGRRRGGARASDRTWQEQPDARGRRGRPCGGPRASDRAWQEQPDARGRPRRPCGGARASDRAWQEQPDARGRRGRPCGGARASDRAWQEQPDARAAVDGPAGVPGRPIVRGRSSPTPGAGVDGPAGVPGRPIVRGRSSPTPGAGVDGPAGVPGRPRPSARGRGPSADVHCPRGAATGQSGLTA